MKNVYIIILALLLVNCTSDDGKPNDENVALLGKWKIIEQLSDPGDGSGTFNAIVSNRTIEFFSNGTVKVNGDFCYMSTEVGTEQSGTYMKVAGSTFSDGEIKPDDCDFDETKVFYKLEGNNLILWYQCIEGCGQKFVKI